MRSAPPDTPSSTLVVSSDDAGARLDTLIARHLPELGRRRIARLIAAGAVRVDGRHRAKGARCAAGSHISIRADVSGAPRPDASLDLDLRLVRDDLIVVHKPAGIPTTPLHGAEQGTLAGALAQRFEELRGLGRQPLDAGLVHRLDTGTSGLLVAGRSVASVARLTRALTGGALEKRYLAIVGGSGLEESGSVHAALRPGPRGRVVISADPTMGRLATTRWRCLERADEWALLQVETGPAYRHQIRAHLASIGHPIAGDTLYGGAEVGLTSAFALHACYVAWEGDDQVPGFEVEAALPGDLRRLLEAASPTPAS